MALLRPVNNGLYGKVAVKLKNMGEWCGCRTANATSPQVVTFNYDAVVDMHLSHGRLTLPPTSGAHVDSKRSSGSNEKHSLESEHFFFPFTAKLSQHEITFHFSFISKLTL